MATIDDNKKLPFSEVNEKYVLGSILNDSQAIEKVIDILKPEMFYNPEYCRIYNAVMALYDKNEEINIVTVTEELDSKNALEYVGGAYVVASLVDGVGSGVNLEKYSKVIAEKYLQREMIKILSNSCEDSYNSALDIGDTIENLQKKVSELTQGFQKQESSSIKDILPNVIHNIEEASERGNGISGIPTGFNSLDTVMQGWQKSNMIVIGGRPGMGKTTFALSLAVNMSKKGVKSLFCSLEMSKEELVTRMIAMESEVNQKVLRSGQLEQSEWESVENAIARLQKMNIYIDDESAITPTKLKTKARYHKRRYNIDILVLDYIQLMRIPGNSNEVAAITEISQSIKALAKDLNIPIIALSQLSRDGAKKEGKPPSLTDLRGSGSIEQDADIVCFVHRPEYYGLKVTEDGEPTDNLCQIVVAKYRNGNPETVSLKFNGPMARIEEW